MENSDTIVVRPYKPSDWDAIEKIHDEARKIELKYANLENAFLPLKIAAEREGLFEYEGLFVAELNSNIVGFISCTEYELAWLYIAPNYMRKGIGRRLSEHVLSVFPNIRYTEVLKGNEPAKQFYESMGFTVVSIESGVMPGNENFFVEIYSMQRLL